MTKKDIIKIMNSDSRNNLSGLTSDTLETGELALITENNYERLYCKNNSGDVVPIHRIADAGEIVIPFVAEPCTFTTTRANESVTLINYQKYAKKITLEDGTDVPITGTGALSYTFAEAGEHKVVIEFKEDVTNFSNCFYLCPNLTSIPENLFTNNTAVTNFTNCFYYCTGLTGSIPENLFSNNTKVTDFSYCFSNCTGLTGSIPENLFANNTAVTNFTNCFNRCSGLTGNTPTDNDGTPIYNRSGEGKEGYAIVTSYSYCFQNCTNLTDYSSIPSGWK